MKTSLLGMVLLSTFMLAGCGQKSDFFEKDYHKNAPKVDKVETENPETSSNTSNSDDQGSDVTSTELNSGSDGSIQTETNTSVSSNEGPSITGTSIPTDSNSGSIPSSGPASGSDNNSGTTVTTKPGSKIPGSDSNSGSSVVTTPGSKIPGSDSNSGSSVVTTPGSKVPGSDSNSGSSVVTTPGSKVPGSNSNSGTTVTTKPGSKVPGSNNNSGNTSTVMEPKYELVKEIEEFEQVKNKDHALDILWVVDNSPSMVDEQAYLARNFASFINNFFVDNIDFRMAITTTDSRPTTQGKIIAGSLETLNSTAAKKNRTTFINNFKNKIKVGIKGNGIEHGFASIESFLDQNGDKFLRDDAYLIVIIVSDEDDQSHEKVAEYAARLSKIKNDPRNLKVFTIADIKVKHAVEGTLVKGAKRYIEFANLTNGKVLDIRQDFDTSLKLISKSVVELINNFKLSHVPEAGSLKIYVDGLLLEDNTFRVSDNIVIFNPGQEPSNGASIRIEYSYKAKL